MKRIGDTIPKVPSGNRIWGGALAVLMSFGSLAPRAEAGYYVSWTNEMLRLAGQSPAHGTTWDVDAFTNVVDAVNAASGARVDLFINVPEETNTIEGAIAKGKSPRDVIVTGKSNVWTTIIIHTNTTPGSGGAYTNSAGYTGGIHIPWQSKRQMTFIGEPRTNVTLKGGFYPNGNDGNGLVVDGLRFEEGSTSYSTKGPRYISLYAPTEATNLLTIRNCHFAPLSAGGSLYVAPNPPYGFFIIASNYFDNCRVIEVQYGSNSVYRGNYILGTSYINLHREISPLVENNTFANGAYIRGYGAPSATWPGFVMTNRVINNNFVNASETIYLAFSTPVNPNVIWVATNNWWGSIDGPYDQTNVTAGETVDNTVEVDENSTYSWSYKTNRNMTGAFFDCYVTDNSQVQGATNLMYVPWATNRLLVNQWESEAVDETPLDVWVGTNYTSGGPGASCFGGSSYKWGINAFTNIQAAVDRLTSGGTVWLAPETFEIGQQVMIEGAVKVIGTQDVTVVSVKLGVESRCFYISNAIASLVGLVISNGYANGAGEEGQGGGVFVALSPLGSSSSFPMNRPVLNACKVVNCRASDKGGGVAFINELASFGPFILNTRITGNAATNHGGGIAAMNSLYLGYCLIDNNRALDGSGGGIYAAPMNQTKAGSGESINPYRSWDYLAQWTVVSNNTAKGHGGGAYFTTHSWNLGFYTGAPSYHNYVIDHIIANWTFVGNKSLEGSGGGAYSICPPRGSGGGGSMDEGLFFFGCAFRNNEAGNNGGGLYLSTGRVDTCMFENNAATNKGGGSFFDGLQELPAAYSNEFEANPAPWIFIGMNNNPTPAGMTNSSYRVGSVSRCTFNANRSGTGGGGGVYASGTNGFDSRSSVWGVSNLVNNIAVNGSGGGIYMSDANLTLSFLGGLQSASNNVASLYGGAICASNAVLSNCTFMANRAGYGGALYLRKSQVSGNTISSNNATNQGGGVFMADGTVMRNSLVSENTATNSGGGLYMAAGTTNESSTIVMNAAPAGSGIAMEGGLVRNSIIWMNYPQTTNWSVTGGTVEYSCAPPSGLPGDGNIVAYPRFMNAGKKDFRLAIGSSCIDRGITNNQTLWMTNATDLIGNARILGDTVDMGAYEGAAGVGPQGSILIVR